MIKCDYCIVSAQVQTIGFFDFGLGLDLGFDLGTCWDMGLGLGLGLDNKLPRFLTQLKKVGCRELFLIHFNKTKC